jgi:hypothetical protein
MSLVVVLTRVDGDKDAVHAEAAERLREQVPTLRWVASYRTHGAYDFVDVLEADEETGDARAGARVLADMAGCHSEWLPAEGSALLRAPGGGAPGGGAPG